MDIIFRNNFDNTVTVIDGSQELMTLNFNEDGIIHLNHGGNIFDVSIAYSDSDGFTQIKPLGVELTGGRNLISMTIDGSAPTTFYAPSPF